MGVDLTHRSEHERASAAWIDSPRDAMLEVGLFLLPPSTAWLVGSFWYRVCDPVGGLALIGMGPLFGVLLGVGTGMCAGAWRSGRPRSRAMLLAFLPVLLSSGLTAWRLLTQPVVFAFDPYLGYFSGPIYDELVGVTSTYLLFRGYNLIALCALLLCTFALLPRRDSRAVLPESTLGRTSLALGAFCVVVSSTMTLAADDLGFTSSRRTTIERLSLERSTEHFVIHVQPGTQAARELPLIVAEHEFAWHRLEQRLGAAPAVPIESFVYSSVEQKRALFGAGAVEVSLPWKRQIYLRHMSFPHEALEHELAHSFGAAFTRHPLGLAGRLSLRGVDLAGGLIEGWANALAPRSMAGLDLHDQAAALDRLDKRPRLGPILGIGFWGSAGRRAYTAAGSFVLWLIETQGIDKVGRLYGAPDQLEAIFGADLPTLEKQWIAFLRARELPQAAVDRVAERFRQPAIFARPCAHRVAWIAQRASAARQRGQTDVARPDLELLCSLEPQEPRHRLTLASALGEMGDYRDAVEVLGDALALPELSAAMTGAILQLRGDLSLSAGDRLAAVADYEAALELPLDDAVVRGLLIRATLAGDHAGAKLALDYFQPLSSGEERTSSAILRLLAAQSMIQDPRWATIGRYLSARTLVNHGHAAPALEYLVAVDADGVAPVLRDAIDQLRLETLLRLARFDDADSLLDKMLARPQLGSGTRMELAVWRERVAFYRSWFSDPARLKELVLPSPVLP